MRTPHLARRLAAATLSVSAVLALGACNDAGPAPAGEDQSGQQQQDDDGGVDEGDDDNGNLTDEDDQDDQGDQGDDG